MTFANDEYESDPPKLTAAEKRAAKAAIDEPAPSRAGLVVGQSSEAEIETAVRTRADLAKSAAESKKVAAAEAKPSGWKQGERIRVLRGAANGWESGCVAAVADGVPLTAKLDASGDTVGLSGYAWESVVKLTKDEELQAEARIEAAKQKAAADKAEAKKKAAEAVAKEK